MTKLKSMFSALAVFLLLSACSSDSSDSYDGFDYSGKSTIEVIGRVLGTDKITTQNWAGKNVIGLYAVRSGKILSDATAYDNRINIKYTSLSTGDVAIFSSAKEIESIQLKKGSLDIIGYAPYKNIIEDCKYPLDLNKPEDVLYSNNAKGLRAGEQANLEFERVLSQLIIQVIPGENVNTLVGLKADNLSGIATKGVLDLSTGLVLVDDQSVNNLKTTVTAGPVQANIQTLILPGQTIGNAKVVVTLEGKQYVWTPTDDVTIESGKIYTYKMTINADGSWTLEPNGTVTDWTEGNVDDDIEVLNPDESESGDIEDPNEETKPGDDATVGEEVVVMNQTFGINDGKKWDLKYYEFDEKNEFSTSGVTFSNKGSKVAARARVAFLEGDKHIWFPAYDSSVATPEDIMPTLSISNINTQNFKDIELSFDMTGDLRKSDYIHANFIHVYIDGQKVKTDDEVIAFDNYESAYYRVRVKIDKSFSTLEFKTGTENYTGIRLDNLVIKGLKTE